ncbi:NAD(P)-dependent oxidoreductase [Terracidiphilus gabretensis]|jgi:putative NADH-flavin reductase|uniref:NAD(P)-dependent oxidoreductase n=1 Tax=Terracidiphilus gabretensis TaxID=1577687 RepID=UPI00071B172F|nr:NAD(P)H-binding protein [Terracidiphilus gabretensis]
MKVVLFGASGMIGSRVLQELVRRGHTVIAAARNPEKIAKGAGITAVEADADDPQSVAAAADGADAAVCAIAPSHDNPGAIAGVVSSLMDGLSRAGVKRLIVVGGAGSLEVATGIQIVDTPEFPAEWLAVARAHREILPLLKASRFDWGYFSPAGLIQPGERTGNFRMGGKEFLTDANGESRISAEDYAVALVDELERPRRLNQQFTIAY